MQLVVLLQVGPVQLVLFLQLGPVQSIALQLGPGQGSGQLTPLQTGFGH